MEPLPGVFNMLQYLNFRNDFIFSGKALDLLNKIMHILWVVALLEACDVANNRGHLGHHLGFSQEFFVLYMKNNT